MLSVNFTFIFVLLNLLILYFVVKKLLFGRIGGILDDRAKAVAADFDAGKESRAQGEAFRSEHENALSNLKEECRVYTEDVHRQAQKEFEKIIDGAKRDAASLLETARDQTARERNDAFQKLNEEITDLIIAAASKVIEANMDTARNRALIDDFIRNRGAAN